MGGPEGFRFFGSPERQKHLIAVRIIRANPILYGPAQRGPHRHSGRIFGFLLELGIILAEHLRIDQAFLKQTVQVACQLIIFLRNRQEQNLSLRHAKPFSRKIFRTSPIGPYQVHRRKQSPVIGKIKGNFIRFPVSIRIPVPESPEHIPEFLQCPRRFQSQGIQPVLINHHHGGAVRPVELHRGKPINIPVRKNGQHSCIRLFFKHSHHIGSLFLHVIVQRKEQLRIG